MRTRLLAVALLCAAGAAYAQTRPLGLPQFADPPTANGADPMLYPNGLLYNTGQMCSQRSTGFDWRCIATMDEVQAAMAGAADAGAQSLAATAATLMPRTEAQSAIATMNARIDGVADAGTISTSGLGARVTTLETVSATHAEVDAGVSGMAASVTALAGRVTTLETQLPTVSAAAAAAQSTATAAGTAASTAQATANAAQSAASANATALTALTTRVSALESALAGLQLRKCAPFSVATQITLPIGGLSTPITVPLSGAPVGTACDVGTPALLPLGVEGLAAVATAGSATVRFQGSVGLIVQAGTYRLCCDL